MAWHPSSICAKEPLVGQELAGAALCAFKVVETHHSIGLGIFESDVEDVGF